VLETYACTKRLEAVVSLDEKPLDLFGKALSPGYLRLLIYEKEYLAILMVVERWRYYLKHDQFIIKTDRESLKYILQ